MKRVWQFLFAAVLCIQLGCSGAAATQPKSHFPYQLEIQEGKELSMNRGEVAIKLTTAGIAEFTWEDGALSLNGKVIRPFPPELLVVELEPALRAKATGIPRVQTLALADRSNSSLWQKVDVAYAIWMAEVQATLDRAAANYSRSRNSTTTAQAVVAATSTLMADPLVESVSPVGTDGTDMLRVKFKGSANAIMLSLDPTMQRNYQVLGFFPEDEAWKLVQSVERYLSRPGPRWVDLSRGFSAGIPDQK